MGELDRMISDFPLRLRPLAETPVTPLTMFADRREHAEQLLKTLASVGRS